MQYFTPRVGVNRARILTSAEVKHALRGAELTRDPERNRLLILISHGCGLRVTECACVPIKAVLYSSGCIRSELTLSALYTKYHKERTVPLSSPRLLDAIEAYLDYRVAEGIGVIAGESDYRGLSPDLPLIMSGRGGGFALARKRRILDGGVEEVYLASDALERVFAKLYSKVGLHGATSHSGRRTYATHLLEDNVPVETIAYLLGHQSIDATYPYIQPSEDAIRHAFEVAL